MKKATAGTWKAEVGITDRGSFSIVSNGVYVAETYSMGKDAGQASEEESKANARLIASAPELLEALKQTEKVFNVEEIDPMQAFIMIEKIRGIIAKAEGRA